MSNRKRIFDLFLILGCGFGLGKLPKMPGTWGTFLGLALFELMNSWTPFVYYAALLAVFFFGVYLANHMEDVFRVHDPAVFVWDEAAAFPWIIPPGSHQGLGWVCVAFILFRVFDIWKPGPIGWADAQIPRGWGVMLDDWLAAVLSAIILYGAQMLWSVWWTLPYPSIFFKFMNVS